MNQQPNEEMGKWTEQNFPKEEVQIFNKYMKKYSTSFSIKEMRIKSTIRFPLTPVWMVSRTQM
jgi:hypothetical protein